MTDVNHRASERKPLQLVEKIKLAEWLLENGVLSGDQFKVAFTLLFSFHNSKDGKLFPSYAQMARAAGVNKRTAIRTVSILETIGALTPIHKDGTPYKDGERNKGGWSERNRYILHHLDEVVLHHQDGVSSAPFKEAKCVTSAPLTVSPAHPSRGTSAPLTVSPAHPHISMKGINETNNEVISEGGPPESKPAGEYPPAGANGADGDRPVGKKPAGATGPRRAKGTRLSQMWEPSERDIEFARQLGMPDPMIQREAIKFKTYWLSQPGAKAEKLDWHLTWQGWCVRSIEYMANNQKARAQNQSAMTAALQRRAEVYRNDYSDVVGGTYE
jgi:hypothetical protein